MQLEASMQGFYLPTSVSVSVSDSHIIQWVGSRNHPYIISHFMFSDLFLFSTSTTSWDGGNKFHTCITFGSDCSPFYLSQVGLCTPYRVTAVVSLEIWWKCGCWPFSMLLITKWHISFQATSFLVNPDFFAYFHMQKKLGNVYSLQSAGSVDCLSMILHTPLGLPQWALLLNKWC